MIMGMGPRIGAPAVRAPVVCVRARVCVCVCVCVACTCESVSDNPTLLFAYRYASAPPPIRRDPSTWPCRSRKRWYWTSRAAWLTTAGRSSTLPSGCPSSSPMRALSRLRSAQDTCVPIAIHTSTGEGSATTVPGRESWTRTRTCIWVRVVAWIRTCAWAMIVDSHTYMRMSEGSGIDTPTYTGEVKVETEPVHVIISSLWPSCAHMQVLQPQPAAEVAAAKAAREQDPFYDARLGREDDGRSRRKFQFIEPGKLQVCVCVGGGARAFVVVGVTETTTSTRTDTHTHTHTPTLTYTHTRALAMPGPSGAATRQGTT